AERQSVDELLEEIGHAWEWARVGRFPGDRAPWGPARQYARQPLRRMLKFQFKRPMQKFWGSIDIFFFSWGPVGLYAPPLARARAPGPGLRESEPGVYATT